MKTTQPARQAELDGLGFADTFCLVVERVPNNPYQEPKPADTSQRTLDEEPTDDV